MSEERGGGKRRREDGGLVHTQHSHRYSPAM